MEITKGTVTICGSESTERLCDGCGLPARRGPEGELVHLKCCSRCKNVWYHDVKCQKVGYKRHRKRCIQSQKSELYHVEERDGRGRCLVASQGLQRGCFFHPAGFAPLVPPVLIESNRSQRCAICFGRVDQEMNFEGIPRVPQYPVNLCSEECISLSSTTVLKHLQEEQRAVSKVCDLAERPIRILPTAILLYRLIRAVAIDSSVDIEVRKLQQHDPKELDNDDEAAHMQAVTTVAILLLRHSLPPLDTERYSLEDLVRTATKIKTNGFSIADGESIAIGIGVFPIASFVNHSCNPNTLQTFVYGRKGIPPALRLTTCTNVPANQEICISYIDNTSNVLMRRGLLRDTYYFDCSCERCIISNDGSKDSKNELKCNVCQGGKDSFCCKNCKLQALIDQLGVSESEQERMRLCHDALYLAEDLWKESTRSSEPWQTLRSTLLKYKCAKIRLYAYPDPRAATLQLQECLQELLVFYPPTHELIQGLKASIREGYM